MRIRTNFKILYVGLVYCAVLTFSVRAEPFEEPFPGYARLCGYPLLTSSTPSVALAKLNRAGDPVIVLDPVLDQPTESHRRLFLIAHECAHHKMGHVHAPELRKRILSRRVVRDHELSADCWAAEVLAQAGLDRSVKVMEDRFYRAGLYSPGGGYPAGVQRATIIRECARIGRTNANAAPMELNDIP